PHGSFDIDEFRVVFRGAPGDLMPCHDLIDEKGPRDALSQGLRGAILGHLVPYLLGEIASGRLASILNYLTGRHEEAPGSEKDRWRRWFNLYLKATAGAGDCLSILGRIRLLDRTGRWKDPAHLVADAAGVDPGFLLDEEQA